MKEIQKNREPDSLTLYRREQGANYDDYRNKDELRNTLFAEQRGICCYCMGAIIEHPLGMKIEHFQCQHDCPQMQLIYTNMLAACKGGEGRPEKEQHCDTYRKCKLITVNPSARTFENTIEYHNDGTISSSNTTLDDELNNKLNLNVLSLKKARKGVLDGFKESIKKYRGKYDLQKGDLEKWLKIWRGENSDDSLRPYCMVVVYWLKKKLP